MISVGKNSCSLKKTSLAIILVLLLIMLSLSFAPEVRADVPFNPEVKVYENYGQSTQTEPSIAVDGNGTAYIVWLENNSVLFSKTSDAGATFNTPVTIAEGYSRPSIAVDESGCIYLFNGVAFFTSTDGGKSFTQNGLITGGHSHTMIVEGDNIYIAYSERTSVVFSDIIWFIKSTDAGCSFGERIPLSDGGYNLDPSVALYNGKIYVTWGSGGNAGRYVEFSRSLDGGETFEPPQMISDTDIWLTETGKTIATGPGGELYVVWFSRANYKVFISKSNNGGQSFSQQIRINDANTTGLNPSVAVDKNGKVHVVWTGSANNTSAIFYDLSSDGGETFGADIKLNTGLASILFYDSTPSIDIADNGGIYAVWQAQRYWNGLDTIFDVYFTTTNNPIFPVTLSPPTGITAGSMNLTWSQSTGSDFGRYELHMATHADFVIDGSTLAASLTDEIVTVYNVTGLVEDTTYYFRVRVYNSGGLYADSNEVSGRTGDEIPAPVVLNVPTDITNSSMILIWNRNGNTDFARYELHMSEDADFDISPSTLIATITDQDTTTYNVTGLAEDEIYYFRIRIYDVGGSHADSNEVSGKTLENNSNATVQKDFLSVLGDNYLVVILVLLIIIAAMVAAVKKQWILNHIKREKGRDKHERSEAKD